MIRWAVGKACHLCDICFRAVQLYFSPLHTHLHTWFTAHMFPKQKDRWDEIVLLLELRSHSCPPAHKIVSHYGVGRISWLAGDVWRFCDVQGSFWRFLLPPSSLSLMVYERAKKRLSPLICLAKLLFCPLIKRQKTLTMKIQYSKWFHFGQNLTRMKTDLSLDTCAQKPIHNGSSERLHCRVGSKEVFICMRVVFFI